ncbi:ArsR/SmtB family transcription factor [Leptolyngbya sp. PCC 6406]|uniref:ArsR/SmtB family transcription factor n=1 Tax=Leptolyngbya sp. PCC 6406 TaxID=1173264 RepID=UPI0002AD0B63|nr:metalloregulator ArsR/SmtB family transcription factor [Leptolyngbya sp. PCC 6406]
MRPIYHPDITEITLEGVLYALGDSVRLAIVTRLAAEGELCCAAIAAPVAKSTLSHHFKILREAGVVYCRKQGTQHLNSLRREELEARFPGLLATILQSAKETTPS